MENNNILPLYHVDEIKFPFIEGSFRGKSGKTESGFFLIDTGSTHNVFNFRAQCALDEHCYLSEKQNVSAVDNKGEECPIINLSIEIGDVSCEEHFCIPQNVDFRKNFGKNKIIGILGVNFLLKHQLVLDFEKKCVRPSDLQPVSVQDKPFIFGMSYGLNSYGVPIVGLLNDDNVYLCIVDSGSNMNTLSKFALENGTQNIQKTESTGSIEGIFGEIDTIIAQADFSLITNGVTKEMKVVKDTAMFQVLSDRMHLASLDDEKTPTIQGLLGTEFMLQRKWILDFGLQVMYCKCH